MNELTIYHHANVITMNPDMPRADAFAVSDGRFCFVGADDQIGTFSSHRVQRVDLSGRTVLPGFIETHNHHSIYAMYLMQVDCSASVNRTIDDVKSRIRERAASSEPGRWILGYGFDDTLMAEKRHLTRQDLDEVAPNNPVFILHISVHLAYANSKALENAGIGRDPEQPVGGEIHLTPDGQPSGLLIEPGAIDPVRRHIPKYSVEQIKNAMRESSRHFNRAGITSIHDGGIGFNHHGRQVIQAYRELRREKDLTLRVYMTLIEELYRALSDVGLGQGFGSDMLKLGSVKTFQDGSIQTHTAALAEPYLGRPDLTGDLIIPQNALNEMVERYHGVGQQMAIHANGDRAIESVLQALERARGRHPARETRDMIIHCQLATADQLQRMKQLGVIPNFFVNHVYYWGDRHRSLFLGEERAARIDPLNSALQAGLTFCLHSDLPVTQVDPLNSIGHAVNRLSREGVLLGPGERVPVEEALKAYTINAAFCSFEETTKGSIEAGKLADFVMLSEDPIAAADHDLKRITVLQTVLGGTTVYTVD